MSSTFTEESFPILGKTDSRWLTTVLFAHKISHGMESSELSYCVDTESQIPPLVVVSRCVEMVAPGH